MNKELGPILGLCRIKICVSVPPRVVSILVGRDVSGRVVMCRDDVRIVVLFGRTRPSYQMPACSAHSLSPFPPTLQAFNASKA